MMPEDRKLLYELIERHTRCTIMARFGPINWPEFGQYFQDAWEIEDEIRDLLFGTHDLVELGERWGLLKPQKDRLESREEKQVGEPKPKGKSHESSERGGCHKGHRKPLL